MLLTATSRQRVYQFRHERIFVKRHGIFAPDRINGADVTNQEWGDKGRRWGSFKKWGGPNCELALSGYRPFSAAFA
jgi:hypothetical protein